MMMRHLLKAMILCCALSTLLYADNPAEPQGTPPEDAQHDQEASDLPAPEVVPAVTCRALGCDIPLTDTIQTATTRDCFTFSVPNVTGGRGACQA